MMDSKPISILLVEDNPRDAELLEFQLRIQGHRDTHIERAKRLSDALECLDNRCYDLILLDLTLPDKQGLDVFLMMNESAPELPIVILTGLADARLALETVRRGAQDYLVKDEIEGRALARALVHAIERKKVEQQALQLRSEAEEMQRRKSEFVAMVSHELRNPMTGIVGFVHLLSKTRLDGIQREYVEAVTTSARALVDLLNNLLELSSAEAGHVNLDMQPLDLRECLENVACFYVPQAHAKGIEIVANVDPEIPDRVMADALRLRQVVVNLLGNALKFTDSGYVGVSARVRASHEHGVVIRFVVEDSGRGIPEDQCKTIFQPFRQVEKEDRMGGKGLGLSICQQLIQAMGGVLGVISQPGMGTGFWFDLAFEVQTPSSLVGHLEGKRALVHDPHEPSLQALVFALESMGAEVTPIRDASHLEAELASRPELVVVGSPRESELDWRPAAEGGSESRWLISTYDRRGKEKLNGACFISRPLRLGDLVSESCPLAVEEPVAEAPKPAAGRVRVVDDDPVCRQLVVAVAGLGGVVCDAAASATDALARLGGRSYQLVIVDFELPDQNGLDLARAIRERGLISAATPIVMLSGTHLEASEHDLDGVLAKPVDPEDLDRVLRSWLLAPAGIDWEVLERLRKYQRGANSNLIRDLVETYLQGCPERILALERTIVDSPEATRRMAHQLRGAATSVGAVGVAAVAERLEEHPEQTRVVRLLQRELSRSMEEFQQFLERPVAVSG